MGYPKEEDLLDLLVNNIAYIEFISANHFIEWEDWDNWFHQHHEFLPVIDQARVIYRIRFYEENVYNSALMKDEVWSKIDEQINLRSNLFITNLTSNSINRWLSYAAIFITVFFTAIWLLKKPANSSNDIMSFAAHNQKESFLLPDSTKLILNKNSRASYSFNDTIRLLKVYGEGYLEVSKIDKKNKRIPFIVENNGFIVEVLGTQFNFIGNSKSKSVALFEGSIRVKDRSGEYIMKPGEVIKSVNGKLSKMKMNSELFKAWNTGVLVLNNTSLTEIINWIKMSNELEIETQLNPQILSQTVSGEIELENETNLYKTLGNLYDLDITESGNKVNINANK